MGYPTIDTTLLAKQTKSAPFEGLAELAWRSPRLTKITYDFARDGGAVGDIAALDDFGNLALLPKKALIMNVAWECTVAVLSGGAGTLAIKAQANADLLGVTAKATLALAAVGLGIPVYATAANYIKLTADRQLYWQIGTAALTAGHVAGYIFWVPGE